MTKKIDLNIHDELIASKIYLIRGHKVMLDSDLAELYQVETKHLKQAVRRNMLRFPDDFMFELTLNEFDSLRSQIVTLENPGRGKYSKYQPFAFTEHGVLMLSSILNSSRAIEVNIQIMRIFVKFRAMLLDTSALKEEIHNIKSVLDKHNKSFEIVADYLDGLSERLDGVEQIIQQDGRKRIGY